MPDIAVLLDGQPLRTRQGFVGFCSNVLIEGSRKTLVDVGHVGRRGALEAALEARGLSASDIDCVVLTHAHWDHAQNLDVFPSAEVLIHPWERRYAAKPHPNDWATPAWSGSMIEHHDHVVEVDEGYEIEPGVSIMHAPGHSPGSICVVVEDAAGCRIVTGDALQYARTALAGNNPVVFWDDEAATRSIHRVAGMADVIYPGHDRPFRLESDEVRYEHPLELTLMGIDPTEGITFEGTPSSRFVMPGIDEQRL
jgi:glyoxylase-like metal-dependent hydrolase (beta-lactamase superfamily II)